MGNSVSCTSGRSSTLGLNSSGDVRARARAARPAARARSPTTKPCRRPRGSARARRRIRKSARLPAVRRDLRVIAARCQRVARLDRPAARWHRACSISRANSSATQRLGAPDPTARTRPGPRGPSSVSSQRPNAPPCPRRAGRRARGRRAARGELGGGQRGLRARASAASTVSSRRDAGDRAVVRARRVAGSATRPAPASASSTPARLDLVPVVILGVDPEDGDRRHAVLLPHALGQPDRGDRLQQREERAAEEAGLLAGDDGDGLRIAQLRGGGDALRRGAATALLRRDDDRPRRRAAADAAARARWRRARPRDRAGLPAKKSAERGRSRDA